MVRACWCFWLSCLLFSSFGLTNGLAAEPAVAERTVRDFIAAGEFAPALAAAKAAPVEQRNALLAEIAAKQATSNAKRGSLSTLAEINDQSLRSQTANWLRQQPLTSARGGGVVADFDTLIDLVTATVSPDSWLDNGGKGTISGFPTGVLVNAEGVLTRLKPVSTPTLDQLRTTALHRSANRDPRTNSKLRKVSLTRLERAAQARYAAGQSPTDAMLHLAGMQRIEYIFVYPETQELVIAGPAGDWHTNEEGRTVSATTQRAVLHLDDFVETLRNHYSHARKLGKNAAVFSNDGQEIVSTWQSSA
jgi:hypothetical protein